MPKTRTNRTACRVLVGLFSVWLGLSSRVTTGQVTRTPEDVQKLAVGKYKVRVYQPSPCYQYPSSLVMMLPAHLALEKGKLKGFSSRLEEIAYRRK